MADVIIFRNDEGGVALCLPSGEVPVETVLEKDCPKDRDARIVAQSTLPNQDKDFFDAWEMTSTTVTVSISKAKEITKRRLRAEREPLLAAQDIAFQRALETGSDTTAIVAEKQRLRDITNLVDTCTTTSDLRRLNCAK